MNKTDLINKLSICYPHINIKLIRQSVKEIIACIKKFLYLGERVEIRGFGSFSLNCRMSCISRNPKNGCKIYLNKRNILVFKMGKKVFFSG